ncbi:aspartate racemase [Bowmanella pacifica]|uniref:Aspartate racemase n=2 Tax=Bowmanella pacifica TaxID=502051 RepID=A0A917YZ32_9ALTE|nr:aspartate racemase [Bowmanella pacifica]
MSWESTQTYYQLINQGVRDKLGGLHSANLILNSLDFAEIEQLQARGDWEAAAALLTRAGLQVQRAGADFLLICTNTMHKVADALESVLDIPLLHIADATATQLKAKGIERVGLLGTAFTMEQAFYRQRLIRRDIEVVTPVALQRERVHQVIYEELCQGRILDASRAEYLQVIDDLAEQGAQAVVLGCTEIGLLVKQADTSVPLFDTTEIHAASAVDWALSTH